MELPMAKPPSPSRRRLPNRPPTPRRVTAYEQLKQAIMEGELQPGEPLVEVALADWCKVSRTPVREALMRLEQDGLVQRGHRDLGDRGLIVRESSPEEILDIYDTRIVLEGRVAAVAAERRTSHELLSRRRAEERYRLEAQDPRETVSYTHLTL